MSSFRSHSSTDSSQPTEEDAIDAVNHGDIDELEQLLNKGLDVNTFADGALIHHACYNGRLAVTKLLIERGADVNDDNGAGGTPLHLACAYGDTYNNSVEVQELITFLLNNGADVNRKDNRGETPLHYACGDERHEDAEENSPTRVKIIKILLDNGADVNSKSNNSNRWTPGWTPLHFACKAQRPGAVKLLLARGADVNSKDMNGNTPIQVTDHAEIKELLRAGGEARGGGRGGTGDKMTKANEKKRLQLCNSTRKKWKTATAKQVELVGKKTTLLHEITQCEERANPFSRFEANGKIDKTMKKDYQKAIKECNKMRTTLKNLEKKEREIGEKVTVLEGMLITNMCESE
uniref:Uncharacterized protein n=1 Tax=viral metagenome TaxID=1070528 RepID=A0A6C0I514_9ZZZZ